MRVINPISSLCFPLLRFVILSSSYPCIYASMHLFIHSLIYLFIHLIYSSIHLFIHPSIFPSIHLSIHSSILPSIHPSIHPAIFPIHIKFINFWKLQDCLVCQRYNSTNIIIIINYYSSFSSFFFFFSFFYSNIFSLVYIMITSLHKHYRYYEIKKNYLFSTPLPFPCSAYSRTGISKRSGARVFADGRSGAMSV